MRMLRAMMGKRKIPKKMHFRIHTALFLKEIANCGLPKNAGVLKVPLNQFRILLAQVAERAAEVDDVKLNCLMIRLGLYDNSTPDHPDYKKAIKYLEDNGEL